MTEGVATISARGASRWRAGHPWIYRSDVQEAVLASGIVRVQDGRGRFVGRALCSPASEIRLRMLTDQDTEIDAAWWRQMIGRAAGRRRSVMRDATAYRVVHAEGDGLPSLVVDRYGDYVVVQLLSAGLEIVRDQVIAAIVDVLDPSAVLLRNDASVRRHERLPLEIVDAVGSVPDRVAVDEGGVVYHATPRTGQKTGAFLDQRGNRILAGSMACGRALDLFTYHGLFALHLAQRADSVIAVDSSGPALDIARENARANRLPNIEWVEANVFDLLRDLERAQERFDVVVLDPPAFAKQRSGLPRATRAYKEINLRAARLLAPSGVLLTCSCSFHLNRTRFLEMLAGAAVDSRRDLVLEGVLGQSLDHPELLSVPETSYLKGALLRAR